MTPIRNTHVLFSFTVFGIFFLCVAISFAENQGADSLLKIRSDSEVDVLITANNLASAEELAREKGLDQRVIASICLRAGKKEEAFALFSDFIKNTPAPHKKELAFQSINLIKIHGGKDIAKEYFNTLLENGILSLSLEQRKCADISFLIRENKIDEAELLMETLLDSTYDESDLVPTAMLLVVRMNMDLRKTEKVRKILEKLLAKFPTNSNVKLQWIDSLARTTPQQSLIELDKLKLEQPEFYSKQDAMIRLIRGKALESLGESDRAKEEYKALLGKGESLNDIASDKIRYFEDKERVEQELQDKIAKLHETPVFELEKSSPYRWLIIVAVNLIVLIIIFLYIFYTKRK